MDKKPACVVGKVPACLVTAISNVDSGKPKPFDFLVGGELIRTSLESLLVSRKISAVSLALCL
jgi:hypothetical protein